MVVGKNIVSVCDWSLRCPDVPALATTLKQLGLEHVHLALGGLLEPDGKPKAGKIEQLLQSGIKFTAGMVGFQGEDYSTIDTIRRSGGFVPADLWPKRRQWAMACRDVAGRLGIRYVTTHIGFVPPAAAPGYGEMVRRLQDVADGFAELGQWLLMETGQEPATELLAFINDVGRDNVGVNFDPANMILYGAGKPIEAVKILRSHIRHVHVKDAVASSSPDKDWGSEVPFGQGDVNGAAFLEALGEIGYEGALAVEREAGARRFEDVSGAVELISGTTMARK